jgi:hypothetical protein
MADWPGIPDAYLWTGGAGIVGRLMYHAQQVQRGRRKPLSWVLLLDLPIALGMGWGALGLGVWLQLPPEPTISIAIAAAHLGPYSVDRVFGALADRYLRAGTPAQPQDVLS